MSWPEPLSEEVSDKLVVGSVDPAVVSQFRGLAETLRHQRAGRYLRTVMVTSAVRGEGRTLVAANLALTLSESFGESVVLLDADLRKPGAHELFEVSRAPGVLDYVVNDATTLTPIQLTRRLSIMPAGTQVPDAGVAFDSPRMAGLLVEASARFDWVIIDSPPAASRTDAMMLAALVDCVLVVAAATTPTDRVDQAIATIGKDRIAGIVLNRAPRQPTAA